MIDIHFLFYLKKSRQPLPPRLPHLQVHVRRALQRTPVRTLLRKAHRVSKVVVVLVVVVVDADDDDAAAADGGGGGDVGHLEF